MNDGHHTHKYLVSLREVHITLIRIVSILILLKIMANTVKNTMKHGKEI